MAIHMYGAEQDGRLPPDLNALLPYLGDAGLLVSPASGREPPKIKDGQIVGEVDYVYLPWPKLSAIQRLTRAVVAYERPENYDGAGTNVAFADGHVEWMEREEFEAALDRSEKARYKQESAVP